MSIRAIVSYTAAMANAGGKDKGRRSGTDRRTGDERRGKQTAGPPGGKDRRSGGERRSGVDRRKQSE